MRWQGWFRGKPKFDWTLEYNYDQKVVPVLTGWRYDHYSETGELEKSQRVTVTKLEVNGNVNAGCFAVEFSDGTHVVSNDGTNRRYFVQKKNGLSPTTESEYGKFESPAP
ncbi:MAG: hypothetical protein R3C10_13010 [Pirellulales bacterium]